MSYKAITTLNYVQFYVTNRMRHVHQNAKQYIFHVLPTIFGLSQGRRDKFSIAILTNATR